MCVCVGGWRRSAAELWDKLYELFGVLLLFFFFCSLQFVSLIFHVEVGVFIEPLRSSVCIQLHFFSLSLSLSGAKNTPLERLALFCTMFSVTSTRLSRKRLPGLPLSDFIRWERRDRVKVFTFRQSVYFCRPHSYPTMHHSESRQRGRLSHQEKNTFNKIHQCAAAPIDPARQSSYDWFW